MRIEKDKRKVNITCQDGTSVKGFVYIHPGERVFDFINRSKEDFIPVTEAQVTAADIIKDSSCVILNKSFIKWVEEV